MQDVNLNSSLFIYRGIFCHISHFSSKLRLCGRQEATQHKSMNEYSEVKKTSADFHCSGNRKQ